MAIIGKDTNLPIAFMSRALICSRGVGRILADKGKYVATGFIITNNLVVTVHRVIPDPAVANDSVFQLDYFVKDDGSFNTYANIKFDPSRFFYTNPDLGISVVALEDHPDLQSRQLVHFDT